MMLRYLTALHVPFSVSALQSPAYPFSRKVVLEASPEIWYLVCPSTSRKDSQCPNMPIIEDQYYLPRLTICGSGLLRLIATQASFIIATELKTQLLEETSLGPVSLRPDLLSAIEDAKNLEFEMY